MKLLAFLLTMAFCTQSFAQNSMKNHNHKGANMHSVHSDPAKPVQDFFAAFGKGDLEGIVATFHEKASITAVRVGNRNGGVYGSYSGKDGVRELVATLGKTFDTKAFSVDHVIGKDNVAYANGSFKHIVKSSGKLFSSDWALYCVIKDGKILEYHFYEDSAALEHAQ